MGIKVLDYGIVKGDQNEDAIDRIIDVVDELCQIAIDNNIKYAVIEDIQLQYFSQGKYGKKPVNVDTFKKLANIQGSLYYKLSKLGIKVNIKSSNTWKSIMQVKGRSRTEQKKNAQLKVRVLYDLKVNQDIADSICMGTAEIIENNITEPILSIDQATLKNGWSILQDI